MASRLVAAVIAAVFLTAAAVLTVVAIYMRLAEALPRPQAMIIVAIGLGAIGGIVAVLACRRRAGPSAAALRYLEETPLAMAARNAVQRDPLGSALAAVSLGVVLSMVPSSRTFLERIIRQWL